MCSGAANVREDRRRNKDEERNTEKREAEVMLPKILTEHQTNLSKLAINKASFFLSYLSKFRVLWSEQCEPVSW